MGSRLMLMVTLVAAQPSSASAQSFLTLPPSATLERYDASVKNEVYRGCPSLRVEAAMGPANPTAVGLVVIPGTTLRDGVLEFRVAGEVAQGADPLARGFVGLAFHVQPGARKYEMFYLRPTNGRADDQLRRNHSLQYVSEPDFPWQRLRSETPGQYESYADLVPGVWTSMRIEIQGTKARLFVNGARQPSLIVNDLKHGPGSGGIGLWAGPGTIGHFCKSGIVVRSAATRSD